jgi:Apea-like HEPN
MDAKAAVAVDNKANKIASLIVARKPRDSQPTVFPSRHAPDLTVTAETNPADWVAEFTDYCGRTTGRYFLHDGLEFALVENVYESLRELVSDIVGRTPFSEACSVYFIETEIFRWMKLKELGGEVRALSSYLAEVCSSKVETRTLLVPLDFIEIERDFQIGEVMVRTIPPALIDRTASYAKQKHGEKIGQKDAYDALRKQLANRAAVEVTVYGEPEYARRKALEIAFDMSGVLRFLSPASVSAVLPSLVQPMGYGHMPSWTTLRIKDDRIANQETQLEHYGLAQWRQPHDLLDRAMRSGLKNLNVFFDGSLLSDYASRVRIAFRGYTRALGRLEPQDRIVGVISALECLFVLGSNDPLSHSVSERMAFLITQDGKERRRIVKTYKSINNHRSRMIHQLADFRGEKLADEFFRDSLIAFHKAIEGISYFETHALFLDAIDNVKFGVTIPMTAST